MLTRRQFHRRAAALTVGGLLSSVAANSSAVEKYPPGKYVDVHTHLGTVWSSGQPLSATELLRWMDAHEVAQTFVLPLISPESSSYPITPEFILAETKPHRDRLIPFCSVDPRTSYQGGQKGLVGMLRRYQDAGAKGFGEHKPGVKVDDPLNMALYDACSELKLPLLFHLDNQRNIDVPGLPGLEKALKAFPGTIFIGHGNGWWASISCQVSQPDLGAYPKGEVVAGGAIDTLMDKYPNLYGDLSAGSGANAISRDKKFGREFLIRRADRLLFGTDFLAPGQPVPQFDILSALDLQADVQAKIFRDNARRLIGL